jgi:hypothetical protein
LNAVAFGVGDNENPESEVISTDGTSRNFKRRRDCVTDGRQVSAHLVEYHFVLVINARHIFPNNPSGRNFAYDSKHFRPEMTVISRAPPLPGNGQRVGTGTLRK